LTLWAAGDREAPCRFLPPKKKRRPSDKEPAPVIPSDGRGGAWRSLRRAWGSGEEKGSNRACHIERAAGDDGALPLLQTPPDGVFHREAGRGGSAQPGDALRQLFLQIFQVRPVLFAAVRQGKEKGGRDAALLFTLLCVTDCPSTECL